MIRCDARIVHVSVTEHLARLLTNAGADTVLTIVSTPFRSTEAINRRLALVPVTW